jgi:hypothetical protein
MSKSNPVKRRLVWNDTYNYKKSIWERFASKNHSKRYLTMAWFTEWDYTFGIEIII